MNPNQLQFHASLVAAFTDLLANDPAYAVAASKRTPEELAGQVLAACLAGDADYSGKGCHRAARACGLSGTRRDIRAFLGCVDAPPVAKAAPKPRKVMVIGFSNIEAAMSGVSRVHRAHDLVTLHYTDGKTESALVKPDRWNEIHDKPFAIVSEVQSRRVPANTP